LQVDGALSFVPASVVLRIAPAPRVTAVPGAPVELLGVAAHEGMVIPVIAIGEKRREMLVCQHAGEVVGLVGGEVLRTGTFDVVPAGPGEPDHVEHDGRRVPPVDVAGAYARVQAAGRLSHLPQ
jgi:hypothetical protein